MALASKMPTQMGMTESEAGSRRTTIGIFVAGSIMSPRILTSISMETPFGLAGAKPLNCFTHQAVWVRGSDAHLRITAWGGCDGTWPGEVDRLVLAASSVDLGPSRIVPFYHYLHCFA